MNTFKKVVNFDVFEDEHFDQFFSKEFIFFFNCLFDGSNELLEGQRLLRLVVVRKKGPGSVSDRNEEGTYMTNPAFVRIYSARRLS